jgi:pre-mRNA-splicing factor 18
LEREETNNVPDTKDGSLRTDGSRVTVPSSEKPVDDPTAEDKDKSDHAMFNIPRAEAVRRLRDRGEPIRLFGESDRDVCVRLRQLELLETETVKGLRNDFQDAMEQIDQDYLDDLARQDKEATDIKVQDDGTTYQELKEKADCLNEEDNEQTTELILKGIQFFLKQWAKELNARPEAVKHSYQGKFSTATQNQTASYLKPLVKQLKKKTLPPDILLRLARIFQQLMNREYVKANDMYLEMAIGNAPWPIGVTMVGIHARTGREKIFAQNVAHVLNDETQRKYIQAVKRLMTLAQRLYPTDPSRSVEFQRS